MTTATHVNSFINSVKQGKSVPIYAFGKNLFDAASKSPDITSKIELLRSKIAARKPIIDQKHFNAFQKNKIGDGTIPVVPVMHSTPEWLAPVLSVAYLKAKTALTPGSSKKLNDVNGALDAAIAYISTKLEPDFIGELLVETTLASSNDPAFKKDLFAGAQEYDQLSQELKHYGETIFPASHPSAKPGGMRCHSTPTGVECENVPDWVAVIVIIVIIIAK